MPEAGPNLFLLGPCWHFFRSWARLKRIFRVLLRLLALSDVFFAFLNAPTTIFKRSGLDFRGFGASKTMFFSCFCVLARLRCPTAANVTKPQFDWVGTHFASNTNDATDGKKSLQKPFEWSCPHQRRHKIALVPPKLVFGGIWKSLGPVLGATWTLLGSFWPLLGAFSLPLGHLLGASWVLVVASGLSYMPLGWILGGLGCLLAGIWKALEQFSLRFSTTMR